MQGDVEGTKQKIIQKISLMQYTMNSWRNKFFKDFLVSLYSWKSPILVSEKTNEIIIEKLAKRNPVLFPARFSRGSPQNISSGTFGRIKGLIAVASCGGI